MTDEQADPSGNTDQFRAFVDGKPAESRPSRVPMIVGVGIVAVVVVVIVVLLLK